MSGPHALVYASRRARADAERLFPRGTCLERKVEREIVAGNVVGADRAVVGDGWIARTVRRPGKVRARPRAWLVLSIERRESSSLERWGEGRLSASACPSPRHNPDREA